MATLRASPALQDDPATTISGFVGENLISRIGPTKAVDVLVVCI
eukprot:CAMPEP_0184354256 /NCGR_PEP_ID=MMETSP1089-20130417/86909_1 /TAXON_ID=38269 ORGANISM="Gloeochaete wittrockiana, Strain SAG46.84" /NCGR_SAMPLE_ID=MMETSP1089 /ASSEMBLY_ACC=CAM_ASM_000445 /LENGTH=43 /DNA_ID= /DNA_START= /DNA_END= /DNA_ORIENTATION=